MWCRNRDYQHSNKIFLPLLPAAAEAQKLRDRGILREDWRADVAIFDPNDFCDLATYADPHCYPSGPRTTGIVNGVVVVENARPYRCNARHRAAAIGGWERRQTRSLLVLFLIEFFENGYTIKRY
jgi:hypothetical protein